MKQIQEEEEEKLKHQKYAKILIRKDERCQIPDEHLFRFSTDRLGCQVLKFSPCGYYLAAAVTSASSRTKIVFFDVREGKRIFSVRGHLNLIHDLDWTQDSRFLSSASSDLTVGVILSIILVRSGNLTKASSTDYLRMK